MLVVGGRAAAQESPAPDAPADERPPSSAPQVPTPAPAPAPDVPLSDDERFRRAQNLFEYGDCESVLDVLGDFTLVGRRTDEAQLVEAHRMLAVCSYQLGKTSDAERELKSLLYLNPDYELDPFLTPPPVVELFEGLKAAMRQKLDEVRKAREAAEQEQATTTTVVVERERVVVRVPWQSVLLPFGFAQAANGELVKGVIVGVAQGVLLGANMASWGMLQALRPEGPVLVVPGTVDLGTSTISVQSVVASAAWVAMAGTFGAFVVSYLVGVGDAWWNYEGERSLGVRDATLPRVPTPSEAAPVAAPETQAKLDRADDGR